MFELFDLITKLYNPLWEIWLYSGQLISGIIHPILILITTIGILFLSYKKNKKVFYVLLVIILYGYIGIINTIYYNVNFKEPYNLSLHEKDIIGDWCKDKNKLTFHQNHIVEMHINNQNFKDTWELDRYKIKTSNKAYKVLHVAGFKEDLYLTFNYSGSGYIDLEYKRCH